MLLRGFRIETIRYVGTCVFGVALLWQIAERAGRGDGEAVIHVTELGVVVMVDGLEYPIDPLPGTPIVCSLRPGSHTLSMSREGRIVYLETFTLDPGGHVVLTARDESRQSSSRKPHPPSPLGPGSPKCPQTSS